MASRCEVLRRNSRSRSRSTSSSSSSSNSNSSSSSSFKDRRRGAVRSSQAVRRSRSKSPHRSRRDSRSRRSKSNNQHSRSSYGRPQRLESSSSNRSGAMSSSRRRKVSRCLFNFEVTCCMLICTAYSRACVTKQKLQLDEAKPTTRIPPSASTLENILQRTTRSRDYMDRHERARAQQKLQEMDDSSRKLAHSQ